MVREPIEQCGGHFGIAEHFGLFADAEVGGDDHAGALVKLVALTDLIVGLTACSAGASNGGSFKPIHYRIED